MRRVQSAPRESAVCALVTPPTGTFPVAGDSRHRVPRPAGVACIDSVTERVTGSIGTRARARRLTATRMRRRAIRVSMTEEVVPRPSWSRVAGAIVARAALAFAALPAAGIVAVHVHDAAGIAVLIAAAAVQVFVRPFKRMALVCASAFAVVFLGFALISPSNERPWLPDVAVPTRVERDGDRVTLRDVRDLQWTGAETFEPRRRDRTIDLSQLDSLWLALSYWDGNTSICHTMFSFGFTDGTYLALSVETRKETGESYSAWRGFFKQYELFYVLAEERDLLGVRAAHRAEDLYLYPLATEPGARRRLLEDILATAHGLESTPEWYGALGRNCTTTLQQHVDAALVRTSKFRFDTVLNGTIDEKAWRLGAFRDERPFAEVRAAHRITDLAKDAAGADDFSRRIRERIGSGPR